MGGVRLVESSGYLDAVLVPGTWQTRQLGWCGFAQGGCRLLGTVGCVLCSQSSLIPRSDCDPPSDCPACQERSHCPCGREEVGVAGRWRLIESVLEGAIANGVAGARGALSAMRELWELVRNGEDGQPAGDRGQDGDSS